MRAGDDAQNVAPLDVLQRNQVADGVLGSGIEQVGRKVLEADLFGATEQDGPLDDVAQFADISRPGVC
jgi:hypothetical protein